ncbi:MAG: DUF4190 domain-containing protein, partial [Candidatus Aureabacteria bacterium]|nr:DUF4190 domain-containing protein [Candidatus Auribacterota bacterium]
YLHAENKAHHICERCGSFICEICLTEIETKKLCPRCFDRLENDGALQTTKTSYFNWGRLILSLSLLSFFCYGFFTAPFIIGLAVYALFQIKKDPEKRGKASVITGIIFSILSMIFWISIFFIPLIIRMAKH